MGVQTYTLVDSMEDCTGKPAVAFSTHGGRPGQTDENVQKMDRISWDVSAAVPNIPRMLLKTRCRQKNSSLVSALRRENFLAERKWYYTRI
jgi:hypothetical protein